MFHFFSIFQLILVYDALLLKIPQKFSQIIDNFLGLLFIFSLQRIIHIFDLFSRDYLFISCNWLLFWVWLFPLDIFSDMTYDNLFVVWLLVRNSFKIGIFNLKLLHIFLKNLKCFSLFRWRLLGRLTMLLDLCCTLVEIIWSKVVLILITLDRLRITICFCGTIWLFWRKLYRIFWKTALFDLQLCWLVRRWTQR